MFCFFPASFMSSTYTDKNSPFLGLPISIHYLEPFPNCKDNTSKHPFSRCETCKNLFFQYELTMTGQSRTTTSRRKEVCTWNCVCVVKLSWRIKPSCWTVRRPTPMTAWKPRSTQSTWNPTMTWHTWWTRECARGVSLLSPCSVSAVTLMSCTHRMAQDVSVFVSSHPCMKWAFLLTFFFVTLLPRGQVVTLCTPL